MQLIFYITIDYCGKVGAGGYADRQLLSKMFGRGRLIRGFRVSNGSDPVGHYALLNFENSPPDFDLPVSLPLEFCMVVIMIF